MTERFSIEREATPKDIEGIINWLEKKPANDTFNFQSTRDCMLAQYLKDTGRTNVNVTRQYASFGLDGISYHALIPAQVQRIAEAGKPNHELQHTSRGEPLITYGEALAQARREHAQMLYGIASREDSAAQA